MRRGGTHDGIHVRSNDTVHRVDIGRRDVDDRTASGSSVDVLVRMEMDLGVRDVDDCTRPGQ